MSAKVIIIYLIIQLIAQYVFYTWFRDWLFKIHSKKISTITWIPIEFTILNIFISLFILVLTGRGGMTGMTNTFASVMLGIIMYVDYNFYYRDIISGKYYEKLAKKEEENRNIEQKLKELEEMRKSM